MEADDPEIVEEEDDLLCRIDWDIMWDQYDNNKMIFDLHPPLITEDSPPVGNFSKSSPDSITSWIGEIENHLMNDDDDDPTHQQFCNDFLADILVDSPPSASACSGEISTEPKDFGAALPSEEEEKDVDNKNNNNNNNDNNVDDSDDPIFKKQKRQERNRDAAVRSRERKKMYVRDLELKSRYLEGECRRLDRLLQCFIAENQALRLTLHKGNAFGVTSAKQESAVLLLESLLLGSLLWFLGIMCLFNLPTMPQSNLVAVQLETVGKKAPEDPRGAGSRMFMSLAVQSLVNGRRCKASRTRMKPISFFSLPVV